MPRHSHVLGSLFICFLFIASYFTPRTSSQSSLRSLSLNGTNQYVTAPSSTSLNITGAITVEGWIKLNSIGAYQAIVSREAFQQVGSGGGYRLVVNDTGKLRLDLFQSHNTYTTAIGTTTITTGVWHHVAGVFDGSQMRVYLDGVLNGSVSTTNGPASGTGGFYIGRFSYSFNPYYFGGLIDEVRVSAAALYTSNFTPGSVAGANVRGLWKFDGQTANDFSTNGNHGTLQNGAAYSTAVPPLGGGGSQPPVPVANGPYSAALGQAVSFSSSGSFDSGGSIVAYHWNFGDGTSANTANPSRTYTAPGFYTATLTVTDNSGLLASATAAVTIANGNQRLDPLNQTGGSGENPLSRNFNWTLPLVSLPGRAGLDLSLSLSYNSLVWTKTGSYISFDDDHGFPGPGFRLGFPVIQPLYFNSEVGKYAFLLIGTDGSRTELRRVGSSVLYEAADSSYLLLDASTMILRTTAGTQLKYEWKGSEFQCIEIKDRNGNYITVNYTTFGRIDTVIDTLGRSIKFNYDANGWLTSITQIWNQGTPSQVTHNWATFAYSNTTIQTNFTGLTVSGPSNGSTIKTLSKVTLADSSHYDFSYTSWGQVWKVSSFAADNHLLNYRSYNLPQTATAQTDCPRFTARRDWAENWNQNVGGVEQEAITTFAAPATETSPLLGGGSLTGVRAQITAPDLTSTKIYFIDPVGTTADWQRGLPALVNTYDSSGTLQRQVKTTWTQDNTSVSYQLNPRVLETNTYDPAGNRKRTRITYQQFSLPDETNCSLPQDILEYQANALDVLRSVRTTYNTGSAYTSRRIIGLVSGRALYAGDVTVAGTLLSKSSYHYDEAGSIQGTDAPEQHSNPNYVTGRANRSSVKRYDVNSTSQFTTSTMKYNTAGSVISLKNTLNHEVKISYIDSYSDGVSRNTLAYPTKITDPDNYWSSSIYNFDFGAVTQTETPPPNITGAPNPQPTGPRQTLTYDNLGRLERTTSLVNNAYTRFEYKPNGIRVDSYATIQQGLGEAHSFSISDGAGRVIASASAHPATPGTSARFDAKRTAYDVIGRVSKTSNAAETSASGDDPALWQLVEGDAGSNWHYTLYTYDWKGRPKVTTNTDGTTKSINYQGCGCAGGEVVTFIDEGTSVNGAIKTRQKKIYSDVIGRTVKSEDWNFNGTGPGGVGRALYATSVTNYNARDQVTLIRQFKGAAPTNYLSDLSCPTGTCQKTEFTYDGYGRLQKKHVPEQRQNPYAETIWTYNPDDTVNTITDGRGAVSEYGYGTSGNNRRLVKTISHTLSGSFPINVSFDYDAAGNRKSMSHSVNGIQQDRIDYTYDQLSRLTSETRHVSALANSATGGNYNIGYQYNLGGQVSSVTDPFGSTTNLNYDAVGRTLSVTGSYAGVNYTYADDIEYRAWGAVKRRGVKTISYNNRLQPTQFRYFQYRYDYNYHPDGQLKHLTDLDDVVGQPSQVTFHYMSRDYGYDHAGRLSRVDANDNHLVNGGLVPAPFVGYYGYDEFNNLASRSGHYALNPDTSDSATFVDNKRTNTGWSYDADGRVLTSVDTATGTSQTWTYDAAGRKIAVSEVLSGNTSTSTQSYDGDGKLLYASVTTPQSTKVDYLIWSTVLESVLTKLDASGNKDITYVPANGLAFPMQTKDINGNPSVGEVWRDVTGLQEDGKAVDPFGAIIHNVQPPTSGSPPAIPFYGPQYANTVRSQFTNGVNNSTGCVLDGQRVDCNELKQRLNDGFVAFSVLSGLTDSTSFNPQRLPGYFETRGEFGPTRFFVTGPVFSEPDPQNPQAQPSPTPDLCSKVNAAFPLEPGQGYYRYSANHGSNLAADLGLLNYAQAGIVSVLINLASGWNVLHPDHPIGIGDLGERGGGGNFNRHPGSGHANGRIIDIRPMTITGGSGDTARTNITDPNYSRDLTNDLVQALMSTMAVERILFNDTQINNVTSSPGHDNHLHVVFRSGAGCN